MRPSHRARLTSGATASTIALLLLTACGNQNPTTSAADPPPDTATDTATVTATGDPGLTLVAIGDSIPYNSPSDCPGCIGFVDQYAAAVETATGQDVTVQNLSDHTGLTMRGLSARLDSYEDELSDADVILIGIAHNSFELSSDAPCGGPLVGGNPDWSLIDAECAENSAEQYRPMYEELYSRVTRWRDGKPTILRTINRYNDWIGYAPAGLTAEDERRTTTLHDAWNTMLCSAAEANGFTCADVYHAFNGSDGKAPAGDLLAMDYVHPSQEGNDVITRVLEEQGFAPLD